MNNPKRMASDSSHLPGDGKKARLTDTPVEPFARPSARDLIAGDSAGIYG